MKELSISDKFFADKTERSIELQELHHYKIGDLFTMANSGHFFILIDIRKEYKQDKDGRLMDEYTVFLTENMSMSSFPDWYIASIIHNGRWYKVADI